ncbi:HD domain-containing protein [Sphingomonas pokkalii]|uniref:Phosphohydrolase n=1 Tax=Sphingomonas pokkalii TaxID=2175090 RepID=A0A2U0SGM1_9SPHN|nr:HD domain-containing protein [Sphingomonas pokkalii]PVX30516.1 phosphohydrolase [Sphingomonas pokkalii]
MSPSNSVLEQIFDAFARHGDAHYGENVSQLDHALQCAQLAKDHGCADTLVAAALLHDIGRMLDPQGNAIELMGRDARHEDTGALALSRAFSPAVTEPVRLHVAAKRYLCAVDAAYTAGLSAASLLSLDVQGGAMLPEEVAAFERERFFEDAVQLRRFDDWGKRIGCPVADLQSYRPLLERLVAPRVADRSGIVAGHARG